MSFFGGPFTSPPGSVDTGVEFAIPLAQLGWNGVSPIRIGGFINGQSNDYLSNQIVGGVPSTQGNLGGDGFGTYTGSLAGINFNVIAGNQYVTFPSVPTVTIGNAGNAADPLTGGLYGAVSYAYNIGQTEVTNTQYAAFLNAVAATDPNGLYNTQMAGSFGGITRAGAPGSYTYATIAGRENNPVNFVSFWDACRFANWMHNGQPTGAQGAGTTEDGAYTLTPTGIANNTVTRNANWRWAVTSENEWYKAAYHQPTSAGGDSDSYWLYPTSSNTITQAQANFNGAIGTPVPTASYSPNFSGTFDMGGNVGEWNESIIGGVFRGWRGGGFGNSEDGLRATARDSDIAPSREDPPIGFRVSQAIDAPVPVQPPNLRPTVAAGPTGDVITVDPTASVPFTYTAQNFGAGAALASGAWTDAAYLSVDTNIDASDFRVALARTGPVGVGATYSAGGTFTGVPPATYNLIVRVNETGTLDEGGQTSDNTLVAPTQVRVVEPVIDLAVATPSVSPTPVMDLYPVTISARVTASGTNLASSARGMLVLVDRGGPGGSERRTTLTAATLNFTGTTGSGATQTLGFAGVLPVRPVAPAAIMASIDQLSASARRDDPSNNSATRAIVVVPAPDLAVDGVTGDTSIVQGLSATIGFTVRNVSATTLTGRSWSDRVYLSLDETPSGDDVQVSVPQNRTLTGDETYTASATLGDGSRPEPGEYFVIVVTNVGESFVEDSRGNNTRVRASKLVVLARPNLRPVGVSVAGGADLLQGEAATVRWTDRNEGPGVAVGPWTDRVVLSKNAVFGDGDDRAFPTIAAGPASLAAGAGAEVEQRITIPIDALLPPGNYSLFVRTNVTGTPLETETSDNVSAPLGVRIVRPPAANLVANAPTVPTEAIGGRTIQVCWGTENLGDAAAVGPWTTRVYLSEDRSLDTSGPNADVLLDEFAVRPATIALAPGQRASQCELVTLPKVVGERYVIVWVNADGAVREYLDTGDNIAASGAMVIQREPTPDLTVASVGALGSAESPVFAGSTVTATFRVLNDNDPSRADSATGATSTPVWVDRLYLSPGNTVRDAGDVLLGSPENQIFLRAGESYVQSVRAKLPEDQFGSTFYLIAETDATNAAAETNETNNRGVSAAFSIQLSAQPDLVGAEVVTPLFNLPEPAVGTGSPIQVTWTETNSNASARSGGNTPAVAWSTRVYLSGNADAQPPGAGDVVLGESVRPRASVLSAGASDPRRSATFVVPAEMSGGEYYLKVEVDSGGAVTERTLEGNNVAVSARTVRVQRSAPNLVPTRAQPSPTALPGGQLLASYTVENRGDGVAAGARWTDRLWLSSDRTIDSSDVALSPEIPRSGASLGSIDGTDNPGYVVTQGYRVPGTIAPGRYWLGLRVNDGNTLNERSETTDGRVDNELISAVQVEVAALYADLSVSTPSSATITAAPGASVRVDWSVTNTGDAVTNVSDWTDAVVLSNDDRFDAGDRVLATVGRSGALGAGASYAGGRVVSLPALGAGDYYLIVRADSGGAVLQKPVGAAPDTVAIPLRVTAEIADLVVSGVTASPRALVGGQRLTVGWTVSNAGSRATIGNTWLDRVEVRTTGSGRVLAAADVARVGALAAQGSYQRQAQLDVPLDAEGLCEVVVRTDRLGSIPEGDETNNAGSDTIEVTAAAAANLVAASPEAPGMGDAGRSIVVSWVVRNESDEATNVGSWTDDLWLSRDDALGGGDTPLGSVAVSGGLAARSEYSPARTATVTLPAGASGSYRVLVRTDANGQVYERGARSDNVAASGPIVVRSANLVPLEVRPSVESVSAGRDVTVRWRVRNAGEAGVPVAAWRDAVYLSRNQTLDAGDVLLGTGRGAAPLAASGEYGSEAVLRVPAGLSGPYFVIVQVNSDRSVPEPGGEGDNVLSSSALIDVTLAEPGDLVVGAVAPPTFAALGLPAEYGWRVGNAPTAGGALAGTWEDSIFLSRDAMWDPGDVFVGRFPVTVTTPLAPGDSFGRSASATTPPVLPGDYYAVVRGDSRKFLAQAAGGSENDDGVSSVSFPVTIPEIPAPGEFSSGDLFVSGADRYFAVTGVESGRTLRISFDHASDEALAELYVARGSIPTSGAFELAYGRPGESSQEVIVPLTDQERYFVLVRAAGMTTPPSGVVRAEYLPFRILSVSGTEVGAGEVSLRVRGAQMPEGTSFALVPSGEGAPIAPVRVMSLGVFDFLVTFDLTGRAGEYGLRASLGDRTDTFGTPVRVTGSASSALSVEVAGVGASKIGTPVKGQIVVVNSGNVDVQVGELIASLPRIGAGAATLTLYPSDASRRTEIGSVGVSDALAAGRLFVGRVAPGQLLTIPYELTFHAPVPSGMGIAIGGQSRTRAEYEGVVADVVSSASDQFRIALLSSGIEPSAAESATAEFRALAEAGFGAALVPAPGVEGEIGTLVWRALSASARLDGAFFDAWLPEVASRVCAARFCAPAGACEVGARAAQSVRDLLACVGCVASIDPRDIGFGGGSLRVGLDGCSGAEILSRDGSGRVLRPALPGECWPPPVSSYDPNVVTGPGAGGQRWISPRRRGVWSVTFQNDAQASAPAGTVTVTTPMGSGLQVGGYRGESVSIGEREQSLSGNAFSGLTTVSGLPTESGEPVSAKVSTTVRPSASGGFESLWQLVSIDPSIAEPPTNPFSGFLPRESAELSGTGTVRFSALAAPLPTGTRFETFAEIVFDDNAPIRTNTLFNTIDSDDPVSAIEGSGAPPRALEGGQAVMSFTASDVGSGLEGVRVLVQVDGGPYRIFQPLTTGNVAVFDEIEPGRVYGFATQAVDIASNVEALPVVPDAITVVPTVSLDAGSDTGQRGDSVTATTTPTFNVVSIPDRTLPIEVRSGSAVVVSGSVRTDGLGRGAFTVPSSRALTDGSYAVRLVSEGVVTGLNVTIASTAPQVQSWASVRGHGVLGELPIELMVGETISEPRAGGVETLEIAVTGPVDPATVTPASVALVGTDANGSAIDLSMTRVTATVAADQRTIRATINPPLSRAGVYCVRLVDVRSPSGTAIAAGPGVSVSVLAGDVNGDERTNANDFAVVRAFAAQLDGAPIDAGVPAQVRADVDRDGDIDAADVALVRGSARVDLRGVLRPCGVVKPAIAAAPASSVVRSAGPTLSSAGENPGASSVLGGSGGPGLGESGMGAVGSALDGARSTAPIGPELGGVLGGLDMKAVRVRGVRAVWDRSGVQTAGMIASSAGVEVARVTSLPMPGWWIVDFGEGGDEARGRAALERRGVYTSPVLSAGSEVRMFVLPRLLVSPGAGPIAAFERALSERVLSPSRSIGGRRLIEVSVLRAEDLAPIIAGLLGSGVVGAVEPDMGVIAPAPVIDRAPWGEAERGETGLAISALGLEGEAPAETLVETERELRELNVARARFVVSRCMPIAVFPSGLRTLVMTSDRLEALCELRAAEPGVLLDSTGAGEAGSRAGEAALEALLERGWVAVVGQGGWSRVLAETRGRAWRTSTPPARAAAAVALARQRLGRGTPGEVLTLVARTPMEGTPARIDPVRVARAARAQSDVDGDGRVTLADVGALRELIEREDLRRADVNGDGMLDDADMLAVLGALD